MRAPLFPLPLALATSLSLVTGCVETDDDLEVTADESELAFSLPTKTFSRIRDLQLGEGVSCRLGSDGATACVGALGGNAAPLQPTALGQAPDASGLSMQAARAYVLKGSDGTAVSFNSTTGVGSATPGFSAGAQIASGNDHTCAIQTDGDVHCWGVNLYRELGREGGASGTATPVLGLPADATDIGAGRTGTCVVSNGYAYCWGGGKLGDGATPTRMSWTTAKRVEVGGDFGCFLSASDRVLCWGANDHAQTGFYADTTDRGAHQVPNIGTVIDVDAGYRHACAVLTDKSVRCWGNNTYGQLGNGNIAAWQQAVSVALPGPARRVRAGHHTSCAILEDDRVFCWGKNDAGELGLGWASTPVVAPALSLL